MISDPTPIPLGELLQRGLFQIPQYQRSYSWREEQVTEFLDDLFAMEKSENDWFLGIVYLFDKGKNKHEVLDGQQRLTTTFILLKELLLFHQTIGDVNDGKRFKQYTDRNLHSLVIFPASYAPRLELDSASRNEFLNYLTAENVDEALIHYAENGNFAITHELLNKSILRIREELSRRLKVQGDLNATFRGFEKIINFLIHRVKLVEIKLTSSASFHTIFELINDRGRRLSNSDKFKSLYCSLTQNVSSFEKDWFETGRTLYSVKRDLDKDVFEFYYRSSGIDDLDSGGFYTTLRDRLRGESDGDAKFDIIKEVYVRIKEMVRLVHAVERFDIYRLYEGRKNERLQKRAKVVGVLLKDAWAKFAQLGVIAFSAYLNFKDKKDPKQFELFLRNLSNGIRFYIAAHLCGVKANTLRNLTVEIARFIGDGESIEKFLNVNEGKDYTNQELFRMLDDASFADNPLSRILIQIIQAHCAPSVLEQYDPSQNWSLEHLVPKKWEKEWPSLTGTTLKAANKKFGKKLVDAITKEDFNRLKGHRAQEFIGNNFVISLGQNKISSNKALKAKQEQIKMSTFSVIMPSVPELSDIRKVSKFDMEDILERTERLSNLLQAALRNRSSF